jgi:hypothetical protein
MLRESVHVGDVKALAEAVEIAVVLLQSEARTVTHHSAALLALRPANGGLRVDLQVEGERPVGNVVGGLEREARKQLLVRHNAHNSS